MLSVEVHGVCQMTVFEKKTIQYISDAYSNFYDCQCERGTLIVKDDICFGCHRENVSGSIACRSQLASVRFLTVSYTSTEASGKSAVTLSVGAYVKYENGTMDWVRKQVDVPLQGKPGEKLHTLRMMDCYGSCNGTELEYRMTIEWESCNENNTSIQCISSVEWDEERPRKCTRPSITVVQGNGSLWDMARKYGSTVHLIQTYNELETDEIPSDTMLLIPRQLN